jgi:hypothetical protein
MPVETRPGTAVAHACLANDIPPLIPEGPAGQFVPLPPTHLRGVRRNVEQQHQEIVEDGGPVKPLKHNFPKFEGTLPNLWFDRCNAYSTLYHVPIQNWANTASIYMEGHAALWLQEFRQMHLNTTWE